MVLNGAILTLLTAQASTATLPPIPREFRAAWVATVANIDWPTKNDLTSGQQRSELRMILDRARELNLNAIVLQVRPSADALYESRLEPWSEFLTGTQGKAPEPFWDPLEYAVKEAHARGIELHCWFNPYRALHPGQKGPVANSHLSKTSNGLVKQYGDYLWMDPSEPAVQEHSLKVMLDVVKRYDIDGVHMDDYFYPYKSYAKGADFPDDESWARYQASGGTLARDDWRRKSVDDFIQRLYTEVKKQKKWVKVGISPFGIYRPGYPADVKSGFDQYAELYADTLKWWENGWCDYFTPQLYWPINSPQPYASLMKWYVEKNKTGRHFWPGNFTSKVREGWAVQEIVDQVKMTQDLPGATGNVHFSMKSLMPLAGAPRMGEALLEGPYSTPAFVPASPWLSDRKPAAPKVAKSARSNAQDGSTWTVDLGKMPKSIQVYAANVGLSSGWTGWVPVAGPNIVVGTEKGERPSRIAIMAIDRYGNASDPVVVNAPK